MNFSEPMLAGEMGKMYFVLNGGKCSKQFHHVGYFDEHRGVYPIYDSKNNVVEYMDIMGNFTKAPTEFAAQFYRFVNYEKYSYLVIRTAGTVYYECAINWFPSKFLINENMRKLAYDIELDRFKKMCKRKTFYSLFETLNYRIYMNRCMKIKLERAQMLSQDPKIVKSVNEDLFGLATLNN